MGRLKDIEILKHILKDPTRERVMKLPMYITKVTVSLVISSFISCHID